MTFSIIARCPRTGQFGVGAATGAVAVGKLVAYALPGVGAIASQAKVNPYIGIDGMELLRAGRSAREVLNWARHADPCVQERQFAILDAEGRTEAFTGDSTIPWSGSVAGAAYSIQGNRLAGPAVLEAAARVFEDDTGGPLAERLMAALEAGDREGGDRVTERSATIYVMDTEEYPLWDVRVDEHETPLRELRRLYEVSKRDLLPAIREMPTRENFGGGPNEISV